jgi:hypothetical protein
MDESRTQIEPIGMGGDEPRADAVIPLQFHSGRWASASVEPALRLMEAILVDAVRCFQRNFKAGHRHGQREFREAQFWIFSDQRGGPFSFEDVCDALGVESRRLRDLIVRWEEDRRSSDCRWTRGNRR